jgi:hypothetical protein
VEITAIAAIEARKSILALAALSLGRMRVLISGYKEMTRV